MADDERAEVSAPQKPYDGVAEAKRLLRTVRGATLATVTSGGDPFASLVSLATSMDGSPLLLVSRLAAHTGHLVADPRCSLLLSPGGRGDPLAHPRLTIMGEACRLEGDERTTARDRFLARHPKAGLYVDFPDFSFWRVALRSGHLNGGFARAASLTALEMLTGLAECESLVAAERGAREHMNDHHRDALALYATTLAGGEAGDWRATGLDPEGIDLACGDRAVRVGFPHRVTTPAALRAMLSSLAAEARTGLDRGPNGAAADPASSRGD